MSYSCDAGLLLGLLDKCPFYSPVENCPFEKYRDLGANELLEVCRKLSPKEIKEMLNYHKKCFSDNDNK